MFSLPWLALGCGPTQGVVGPSDTTEPPHTGTPPVGAQAFPQFDGDPPSNVLVLSLDTMRRDHMSRYGAGGHTPFLDRLASEGFVLDDFTACSNWTVAGTACALAGATNLDRAEARGMVPILVGGPLQPIPRSGEPNGPTPLLPRWLGDAGYSTLLVTSNGYFSASYGNAQGYQRIDFPGFLPTRMIWDRAEELMVEEPLEEPWLLHLHGFEPHRPYLPDDDYLATLPPLPDLPFDMATEAGQNQAVAAVYSDPPFLTPDELAAVQEHFRLIYAGDVERYDRALESVWGELDAAGTLDDTLVVFWTDHGEALFERGYTEHGHLLHRDETDAIAWFWAKNIVPGVWDGPTAQEDLTPTILTVLGMDLPAEVTGTPVGLAAPDRARHAFADAFAGPVQTVRRGDLVLEFRWDAGERNGVQLYDVIADPTAQTDLFDPLAPSSDALELWELLRPKVLQAEPFIAADPRGYPLVWPEGLPTAP